MPFPPQSPGRYPSTAPFQPQGVDEMTLGLLFPPQGYVFMIKPVATLYSVYNLCSTVPDEKMNAQPDSAYNLCNDQKKYLTSEVASAYNLSTA